MLLAAAASELSNPKPRLSFTQCNTTRGRVQKCLSGLEENFFLFSINMKRPRLPPLGFNLWMFSVSFQNCPALHVRVRSVRIFASVPHHDGAAVGSLDVMIPRVSDTVQLFSRLDCDPPSAPRPSTLSAAIALQQPLTRPLIKP